MKIKKYINNSGEKSLFNIIYEKIYLIQKAI